MAYTVSTAANTSAMTARNRGTAEAEQLANLPSTLMSCQWSRYAAVTSSPLVEHLALAACDSFVAIFNLCLMLLLKPTWYQELSDDVELEGIGEKPSILYVSLLALVCGIGGASCKATAIMWCLSQGSSDGPKGGPAFSSLGGWLFHEESIGGYRICPRVVRTMSLSWVFVTAVILQLFGAPLESFPSSVLLGVFFATIGFIGPFASAIAESCRSRRWETSQAQSRRSRREQEDAPTNQRFVAFPAGKGLGWLHPVNIMGGSLRCMDFFCIPIVSAFQALQSRSCRRGSNASLLHPQDLGNLLVILSVLPLIACCTLCILSAYFLPMDWPTKYVVYPAPLVMLISVGYPLASLLCFFVLLLLPVYCKFPNHYARALPVIQELMLKPSGPVASEALVKEVA